MSKRHYKKILTEPVQHVTPEQKTPAGLAATAGKLLRGPSLPYLLLAAGAGLLAKRYFGSASA